MSGFLGSVRPKFFKKVGFFRKFPSKSKKFPGTLEYPEYPLLKGKKACWFPKNANQQAGPSHKAVSTRCDDAPLQPFSLIILNAKHADKIRGERKHEALPIKFCIISCS